LPFSLEKSLKYVHIASNGDVELKGSIAGTTTV
jgi:hypothetical protein